MGRGFWAPGLVGLGLLAAAGESGRAVAQEGTASGSAVSIERVSNDIGVGSYTLKAGATELPAQVIEVDGGRSLVYLKPAGLAEKADLSTLKPLEHSKPNGGVEFEASGRDLEIRIGGKPFTTLRGDLENKPYFWPLVGPTGVSVTRGYPTEPGPGDDKDHPHQRSFWFTHGDVSGADFWASDPINKANPRFGMIHETRRSWSGGPVVGTLDTENDWIGPDGKVLLSDQRRFRFYAVTNPRILDVEVTLRAGANGAVMGDTKEGMFGLRLASSMNVNKKQGGRIVNAEGLTDGGAWGKASPWVDYTGPLDGKTVGVAILNHPSSFRFPTTWHVRDYGLFAANPFGYHDFGKTEPGEHKLAPGESITFRYRLILHEGDTKSASIADSYQAYAASQLGGAGK